MESRHEKPDVLYQHGDESAENTGRHGDTYFPLQGQEILLQADEIDDYGAEDKSCHEHHSFEKTIPWRKKRTNITGKENIWDISSFVIYIQEKLLSNSKSEDLVLGEFSIKKVT